MEQKNLKSKTWLFIRYLLLTIVTIGILFPIYFMVTTSIKYPVQTYDPSSWLFRPTFENYISLFKSYHISPYLINSLVVTTISVLLALFLGSLTAYGFVRYNFKRKEDLAAWMLSLRFLPALAGVIPFFILANFLHILDTYLILIISYLTFNVPFAVWMLRGFFEEIPKEIEEAASIDGASHFQALIRIIFPLAKPGLLATASLLTIMTWNEFTFALFLTTRYRTMPTITAQFQTVRGIVWGEMAALGVITTLPVIIFAIIARKYLVRGLTFGAVK